MFKEDYSYVTELQKKAVDSGLGRYYINYVNLNCSGVNGEEMKTLCDNIADNFMMYQYRKNDEGKYICSYRDKWDIYYYGDAKSYVKLSFNDKKSVEEKLSDTNKLISLLKEYNSENISVSIQYGVELNDEEMISKEAEKVFKNNENKFIEVGGKAGKIKKVPEYNDSYYGYKCNYGFFKKGSRTKYYGITDIQVAMLA